MVLIQKEDYITVEDVVVDNDEFKEAREHRQEIMKSAEKYLDGYVRYVGKKISHEKIPTHIQNQYKYTTLSYFHDILKLPEMHS